MAKRHFEKLLKRARSRRDSSDEMEAELHKTKLFVRRKLGTAHYHTNSTPTAKHGGGKVVLWRGFSAEGTGRHVSMEGTTSGPK